MDDLGNILYILAMLAAVVFSAFKKKKQVKRAEQMPEEMPTPYHPMDEDDIVRELKELFQQPKAAAPEPVKSKVEPQPFLKPENTFKPKNRVKEPKKPIFEEAESVEEGFGFNKEQIDLRQAVIYSEILRRPYE